MKDRVISVLANIGVAAAFAFASLGVASISDPLCTTNWVLFSVAFAVTLGLTFLMPKQ